ncbi:NADH-quinone oxidoreductase subunit C [Marinilongibacter aquaticus]|uniref:NADH-quinone oxidoreductase subunit C n=1 Tax=Marinilongibacter aquaticus TaxID=2975157 RepID=UPI0021BD9254|nr:NADH-quinone oxidoreductase subunit C [Marinilongibacter aquaticus]UBM58461.1 NADH-quinone oxidoreductase subunit C [Marinilongibacter aquaticus]
MNLENFENIVAQIHSHFGEDWLEELYPDAIQAYAKIKPEFLLPLCRFLLENENCYFDLLNAITAIDNGPQNGQLELWYHLTSIPLEQSFILMLSVPRGDDENLPEVDSVSSVWKTADWHEREAYDLMGVKFTDHPDLRRILLPADWKGHPLRKDYQDQTAYHGIKIKY